MSSGSKIKRIALILNLVFNAILGFIIFQISNIAYRNNRIKIWMNQKEFDSYFFEELQQITPYLWMIWGALVVLSIFLLICEYKKSNL
jgi:hypothetical protein